MKRLTLVLLAAAVPSMLFAASPSDADCVAHEWGTFTSVQGPEGTLLSWKPLETSELPGFVYDWKNPGFGRMAASPYLFGGKGGLLLKGGMVTLQRMETPVIYFYSDNDQDLDVSVHFPQGLITEWFPQAAQIGPSRPLNLSMGRSIAQTENQDVQQSMIRWPHVHVLPAMVATDNASPPPKANSGSHYFTARDTGSAYLRVDMTSNTNSSPEYEKFLFYRGVGNFSTPLRVTMKTDDAVTAANTGKMPLRHLFVLRVRNKTGRFMALDELQPGQERTVDTSTKSTDLPLPALADQLGKKMTESLVAEGLYSAEAKAMVNTWKDSWFAEDGVRVLYLLPRAWTDQTLPMDIHPAPKELVRVMVGRAEVVTPGTEDHLVSLIKRSESGETAALQQLHASLQILGRFAQPSLELALARAKAPMEIQTKLLASLAPSVGKDAK